MSSNFQATVLESRQKTGQKARAVGAAKPRGFHLLLLVAVATAEAKVGQKDGRRVPRGFQDTCTQPRVSCVLGTRVSPRDGHQKASRCPYGGDRH